MQTTGQNPDWVQGTHVFDYGNLRIGVIGIELKKTPELVSAGATAGLKFLDEIDTIKTESEKLRKQGVKVQIVLIHQGTANGPNAVDGNAAGPVGRADHDDRAGHPGHDGGCRPGRSHPPRLEPDGRQASWWPRA